MAVVHRGAGAARRCGRGGPARHRADARRQLGDWGWRLPFLLALPFGLAALWLRLRLEETPSFEDGGRTAGHASRRPAREVAGAIALGAGRLMGWAAAGYTFLVVMPSYLQTTLDATFQQALIATVLANLGFAAPILPAGLLSDLIGRRPVMLTGAALVDPARLPLLNLLQEPGVSNTVKGVAVCGAGAVVGLMAGPGPAMLAEMFPTRVRYTGLGLAYALSNAVFSGCAGLIITETIKRTGSVDIPAYYAAAACAVSVIALLTLRGDAHRGTSGGGAVPAPGRDRGGDPMRVIGLMSGTSYDAMDAAAADLALVGDTLVLAPLGLVSAAYPTRTARRCPPPCHRRRPPWRGVRLDTRIGQAFAAARRPRRPRAVRRTGRV